MSEHTPTPWMYSELETGGFKITPAGDPSFKICRIENAITYLMAFDDAAIADTQLIVRAVNSHDALVKALELAEDALSRSPFSTQIWPNGVHPQVGIEQIRAALTHAQQSEGEAS